MARAKDLGPTPINDLRTLTEQQQAHFHKRETEIDEAIWLITEAMCPTHDCGGAGVCEWCQRAANWLRNIDAPCGPRD